MCKAATYSVTPDDSKAIDRQGGPMIVISASGMALVDESCTTSDDSSRTRETTVLFTSAISRQGRAGRALVDGADELKIHGQYVKVKARVARVDGLSAHADYAEMVEWLKPARLSPRKVFVTHGEPAAADAFRGRLRDTFGGTSSSPTTAQRGAWSDRPMKTVRVPGTSRTSSYCAHRWTRRRKDRGARTDPAILLCSCEGASEAAGVVFGGGFPREPSTGVRRAGQRAIFYVQRELETAADCRQRGYRALRSRDCRWRRLLAGARVAVGLGGEPARCRARALRRGHPPSDTCAGRRLQPPEPTAHRVGHGGSRRRPSDRRGVGGPSSTPLIEPTPDFLAKARRALAISCGRNYPSVAAATSCQILMDSSDDTHGSRKRPSCGPDPRKVIQRA